MLPGDYTSFTNSFIFIFFDDIIYFIDSVIIDHWVVLECLVAVCACPLVYLACPGVERVDEMSWIFV